MIIIYLLVCVSYSDCVLFCLVYVTVLYFQFCTIVAQFIELQTYHKVRSSMFLVKLV